MLQLASTGYFQFLADYFKIGGEYYEQCPKAPKTHKKKSMLKGHLHVSINGQPVKDSRAVINKARPLWKEKRLKTAQVFISFCTAMLSCILTIQSYWSKWARTRTQKTQAAIFIKSITWYLEYDGNNLASTPVTRICEAFVLKWNPA